MKSYKVDEIKEIIKGLLKKNKLNYVDLAEHLECSEPTIKRILGPEEMSLSRLLQICEFLKLNLSDLEALMKKSERETIELSEKQQLFLVQNKNHFAYLMEIYQGLSTEQIAMKYKLNAKSTQRYLNALEKHDLIKITSKNKVRPFYSAFPHLGKGPLGTAYFRSLIQNSSTFLIDHIADEISSSHSTASSTKKEGSKFAVQTMSLSPETFQQLTKDLEAKLQEYEKIAQFEEKTIDKKKLKTSVVIIGSTLVADDYKGLETLQRSFGEVTPI